MSRIAKQPVALLTGVTVDRKGRELSIKGPKGTLSIVINNEVEVSESEGTLNVVPRSGSKFSNAMAGTTRALMQNMVIGVTDGYMRKLELVGVGYRAQAQGQTVNLTLGFSHPVQYAAPEGISIETPSQTEILIKGIDRQKVGQVAADIRKFRPPEPYKGKGVRHANERIVLKEAKKK
jgi:large subunit ribosomal protein L6